MNKYALIIIDNNEINQNNINFRKNNGIPVYNDLLEELPTWALNIPKSNIVLYHTKIGFITHKPHELISNSILYYLPLAANKTIESYLELSGFNLKSITDSDWKFDYDSIDYTEKTEGIARIASLYGCGYNCNFCTLAHSKLIRNELFDLQLDIIKKKYNSNWIYLDNKSYGQTPEERNDVSERLKDFNVIVQSRVDIVNAHPEYFESNNIKYVELGVESFSTNVLKGINKKIEFEDIKDALIKLYYMDKKVIINLMINTPYHGKYTYLFDLQKLLEFYNTDYVDYFNITVMCDYNSSIPSDVDENIFFKSWNPNNDNSGYYTILKTLQKQFANG